MWILKWIVNTFLDNFLRAASRYSFVNASNNDDSKVFVALKGYGGVSIPKEQYLECMLSGND